MHQTKYSESLKDELLQHGQGNLQNVDGGSCLMGVPALTLPEIPNDYLQDTLKAINGFKHYDLCILHIKFLVSLIILSASR